VVWLFVAIGAYLLVICFIAWLSLHPMRTPLFLSPGVLGAPQEEFEIPSTDGVTLKCWWVQAVGARTVAVLCHGYVMNRSELTPVAYWLWKRGVTSLLFDFRAHGHSRGGVSTVGWKEGNDVAAAIREARRRVPGARILLIGSSMGSAACAFAVAGGAEADAIVLDSCYSLLTRASLGWWRFLGGHALSWILGPTVLFAGPLAGINPFKIDVGQALRKVKCPVLLLHGRHDNLAQPREADRNLAALGDRGEIVWFDDCGHSEFRWAQPESYYQELQAFLIRQSLIESASAPEATHAIEDATHATEDEMVMKT
jgi:alpha-beta hydrolase superfamily lysophospholipase